MTHLHVSSLARRARLCAALVGMLVPAAAASAVTVILDNTSVGYSVLSQTWSTSTQFTGYFGTNYASRNTSNPVGQVEWRPTLPQAGSYEVAVWYNSSDSPTTKRASDVHYTVDYDGGTADIMPGTGVNQQINWSRWVVLGTFPFAAGTTGRLVLSSQSSQANRSVIADAVRFQTVPATFTESSASVLGGLAMDARSASFADIDNDGDLDVLIQPTAASTRTLLRNNVVGLGTPDFTNITSMLNGSSTTSWSAAWGDYDGDGDVDVFCGQSNSTTTGTLLRNDGAAGFTDVSVATGLNDPGFAQNVAWCDIDRDGDLDLIIAMEGPEKHQVYLQGPPGHFTPVGLAVGFQVPEGIKAYGMAIGDTDGDGDYDIFIATCRSNNNIRDNFFKNLLVENGALSFVDIADTNGTQNFKNSYNTEFLDFDDDGDLDLFVTGADGEASKIFRNDGNNQFTDIDTVTGHPLISDTGGDFNGGRAIDYDNDGDLDLYFHDHLVKATKNYARMLYRNDGNWTFAEVTVQEGLFEANIGSFLSDPNQFGSYDDAWGDFDRDGDLDLLATTGEVQNFAQPQRFFVSNVSTNGNHWLFVRLQGTTGNTTAIGSRLYATINTGGPQQRTLRREANSNAGTFHQSDLPVHFGLGSATTVDQLVIAWPNGIQHTRVNVPVDHYVTFSIYPRWDFDQDLDVDSSDLDHLIACRTRSQVLPLLPGCADTDSDGDGDSDLDDFGAFQRCVSGSGHPQTLTSCLRDPVVQ